MSRESKFLSPILRHEPELFGLTELKCCHDEILFEQHAYGWLSAY